MGFIKIAAQVLAGVAVLTLTSALLIYAAVRRRKCRMRVILPLAGGLCLCAVYFALFFAPYKIAQPENAAYEIRCWNGENYRQVVQGDDVQKLKKLLESIEFRRLFLDGGRQLPERIGASVTASDCIEIYVWDGGYLPEKQTFLGTRTDWFTFLISMPENSVYIPRTESFMYANKSIVTEASAQTAEKLVRWIIEYTETHENME